MSHTLGRSALYILIAYLTYRGGWLALHLTFRHTCNHRRAHTWWTPAEGFSRFACWHRHLIPAYIRASYCFSLPHIYIYTPPNTDTRSSYSQSYIIFVFAYIRTLYWYSLPHHTYTWPQYLYLIFTVVHHSHTPHNCLLSNFILILAPPHILTPNTDTRSHLIFTHFLILTTVHHIHSSPSY